MMTAGVTGSRSAADARDAARLLLESADGRGSPSVSDTVISGDRAGAGGLSDHRVARAVLRPGSRVLRPSSSWVNTPGAVRAHWPAPIQSRVSIVMRIADPFPSFCRHGSYQVSGSSIVPAGCRPA